MNILCSKKAVLLFLFCGLILSVGIGIFTSQIKTPLISVIMPTYNRADLLPRVIDSILNQTMTDFEFVIVDDGSTDNSTQILDDYQKKDKRIKVVRLKENKGVAFARQTGLDTAKGKYIAIMDSDDIALPLFLEKAARFLKKHEDTTILKIQPGFHEDGKDPFKDIYTGTTPIYKSVFAPVLGNVGIIFQHHFVKKNNIRYNPEYDCAEDFDFWSKMIMKGATIRYLDNKNIPLYSIRYHLQRNYGSCYKYSDIVSKKLLYFFNIPLEQKENYCFILKKAIQFNPRLFDAETTQKGIHQLCPPEAEYVFVKHPAWEDYLVFSTDKTRVYRHFASTETAQVISFIPQKEITIKWEAWGRETFLYSKENTYQLKTD